MPKHGAICPNCGNREYKKFTLLKLWNKCHKPSARIECALCGTIWRSESYELMQYIDRGVVKKDV